MEQRLRDRIKNISEQKLNVGLDLTQFNEQIGKVRDELRNLGAAGSAAFDSARMGEMKAQLESSMTLLELMAQKLKELGNTGMEGLKKRAAESAENSYNKLLLKLKEVEAEYNKLDAKSADPITGAQGARGQELLSQIQSLRGALREIDALKKSVNSIGDNEGMQRWSKAFAEAEFAASSTGKSIALLKAQTAATNKETVEAARVADMARGSYDQLRAELDKTIAEYKAMSEAVRGTKKGSDTLAYIHELQSQIKAIDDAIKPVQQKLSKLQQLQNQLAELNTAGSTAQSEIEAQHAVNLAKERVKLETEYINIKDRGAASDEIYVQSLRQEVALMKQLEALQVQRRNLADPNSDERKVLALQQEIALQREQLSLENQRARLQMQLTHYSQYGQEEASLREELRLKKELAETDARLMHYYTAEAEELRKNQQKIALLQRQEQLERERVRLQERLQALQSGQDHENMALKTKVQLEEQLARLRAKRTWLGQTNGSGTTNAEEMKRLNREIRELTSNASTAETRVRDVNRAYRQGVPLLQSLVNLARNYVGVWGLWSGLRSLYRIRAEFERQEVALRALMQSASQAREVMGQLQQMALKSPFSVSDIVSFSKQLSAFSIGNNELVETTKRLADLSAGLGVDMSRLILAYGQVKAATVLRGQELRQFTEAGVPMVQALADQFTKLEGRVVTAADVFDRISKKAVSFEMVKQVLDSMTSEGGRFYDHQAKMVETLYGKMERLGDAYKVMMNNLGKANDALLKWPIDAITNAMMNWRSSLGFLLSAAIAGGLYKMQRAYGGIAKAAAAAGKSTGAFMKSMVKGPALAFALAEIATKIMEIHQAAKAVNDELHQMGKDLATDVGEYLSNSLGAIQATLSADSITDADLDKVWESLRTQLEHMSGSELKITELLDIDDLQLRSYQAIEYLKDVEKAAKALEGVSVSVSQTKGWEDVFGFIDLNLGEGLVDVLQDVDDALDNIEKKKRGTYDNWDYIGDALKAVGSFGTEMSGDFNDAMDRMSEKAADTAQSIYNAAQKAVEDGLLDNTSQDQVDIFIKNMIDGIERQSPTMSREARAFFEQTIYRQLQQLGVEIGEYIPQSLDPAKRAVVELANASLASTATVTKFEGELERQARLLDTSLKSVMEGMMSNNDKTRKDSEDTFKLMCQRAVEEAKYSADGMYNAYAAMVSQLSRLEIVIRSRIIGPAGEVSNFQKEWDRFNKQTDNKYRPKPDEEAQPYGERMKKGEETEKARKNYAREMKQRARDAKERKHWAEEEAAAARDEAGYAAQANQYYVDIDKHGDYKAPKAKHGGGKGTKRDEWLDEVKNRLNEYKEARSEVDKLRKAGMSETKAIAEVLSMTWSKGLDKQYLGEGGMNALVEYLLPYAKNHAKGLQGSFKAAADKFVLELQKLSNSESVTRMTEASKRLGDEIKKHIEVGVKQWKLYDALFAATGDEALSANAAFGGKKLFRNIEDQLIALFNQNEGKVDFSDALQIDEKTLSEKLLKNADEYIDLLKRIKEMRESGWSDIMTKAAEAMEAQMTLEEKLQKQRMVNQKELADFVARNGGMQNVQNNAELLKLYNALRNAGLRALAELEQEGVKLSAFWKGLFDKLSESTLGGLRRVVTKYGTALKDAKRNGDGTWTVPGIDQPVTEGTYREMVKRIEDLREKIREMSLTDYLSDLFGNDGLWRRAETLGEKMEIIAIAVGRVHDELKKATGPMKEFFSALGNDTVGDYVDFFDEMLNGITELGTGAARMASGDLLGGGLQAVGGLFSTITSFFNFHDKRLEKLIEESKRTVSKLENAYSQMEKALERSLGGMYTTRSYRQQLNNLMQQRKEVQRQMDAERDKKKTDKDALIAYQQQLAEMDEQIKHFAEDMANSLYGIDIKNWAKQLTDAVVNAWRNGENAVEAYRDKVKDIIAEVATSIISQKIMEAALQPVLDTLVAEMTAKNGLLDEGSIMTFATMLGNAGENAVGVITGILDGLKAQGYDLTSGSAAGTLGQGIKEITEDQANLLASYINAMRADLSVVRMLWEQHALGLSVVSQAQLTELAAISANTLRNAEAAERIEAALGSVITVGASGARVRV